MKAGSLALSRHLAASGVLWLRDRCLLVPAHLPLPVRVSLHVASFFIRRSGHTGLGARSMPA